MTLRAGVAGQPIAHSLSPLIHGAWIAAAGLDATYEAFGPADAEGFAALVAGGRAGGLRGLNVTAPFKEQALALADAASPIARACGSANLLVFEDGRATADSTDGEGLLAALAEQAPDLRLAGAEVVVLGAGGAARAAARALKSAGATVRLVNRSPARAQEAARDLGVDVGAEQDAGRAALIVNATGTTPTLDPEALRPDAVLMDMSYRPVITPWLAAGRGRGLAVVDGLAMLIGQAQPSFRTLFGQAPPPVDVRALALKTLGETA